MICGRCNKDIPQTSMWYCYRNGVDYCNRCMGEMGHDASKTIGNERQ